MLVSSIELLKALDDASAQMDGLDRFYLWWSGLWKTDVKLFFRRFSPCQ